MSTEEALALAAWIADTPARITERSVGWAAEEAAAWSTDASVLRAWARDQAAVERSTADTVRLERHLRKLSRAQAVTMQTVKVKKPDGTVKRLRFVKERWTEREDGTRVTVGAEKRVRKIRGYSTDQATGEIRDWTRHVIGFYQGGAGFLVINDGRVTADGIRRVLGGEISASGLGRWNQADYVLAV
jgi:hypothetical protein